MRYKELSGIGIKIQIPEDNFCLVDYSDDSHKQRLGYRQIRFMFHPLSSGEVLVEPRYLMTLVIIRIDKGQTAAYLEGKDPLKGELEFLPKVQQFTTNMITSVIKVVGGGRRQAEGKEDYATIMRKDIVAANGDFLICGSWIFSGEDVYMMPYDDIEAVGHMMGSIVPTR